MPASSVNRTFSSAICFAQPGHRRFKFGNALIETVGHAHRVR